MKPTERSVKNVTQILEENPGVWFPRFLASLGNVDTTDAHLLLQDIIDDLSPTAGRQCQRIAQRRCGIIFQVRH